MIIVTLGIIIIAYFSEEDKKVINGHTHTSFSHDGKGTVEDLCLEAISCGLSGFAVTDHCDCECANDKTMTENIKASFFAAKAAQQKYADKLTVIKGIEIGEALFDRSFAEKMLTSLPWDMVLGSVHAVRYDGFTMPFSVIDFSDKSDEFIDKYVTLYFEDLLEMSCTIDYDVLSHLTVVLRYVIHKYNRRIDISKHNAIIEEILKSVITNNKALEVNTSGFCDGYLMPDINIVEAYYNLGGRRIILGSDAHTPEKLTQGLEETAKTLKEIGFDSLTYYINRKPFEYSL